MTPGTSLRISVIGGLVLLAGGCSSSSSSGGSAFTITSASQDLGSDPDGRTTVIGFQGVAYVGTVNDGGDSGSAVFNSSDKVVGLHFAGSSSTSIFNRIGHVLDALGVELVTTEI